jgi:hypothetical protein
MAVGRFERKSGDEPVEQTQAVAHRVERDRAAIS